MTRHALTPLAAALALLGATAAAPAQEAASSPQCSFRASGEELTSRASPPDSASVSLDGGVAKICYSSPRARGREIMGDLVPYGQPWRLGANEPTTLHLTTAARVGDVHLDPGAYALYAVPGEEKWEIVVNAATERWGIPIDEDVRADNVGSVTAPPGRTDAMVENLTITFEDAEEGTVHLVIEWERTRVEVPVRPAGG